MKYHVRKDENGKWVEESGRKIPKGAAIVYHYGRKPVDSGMTVATIRSNNPHYSANAGIHVEQVERFNKQCATGTHYEKGTGRLVSNSHKARECEARRRGLSFS